MFKWLGSHFVSKTYMIPPCIFIRHTLVLLTNNKNPRKKTLSVFNTDWFLNEREGGDYRVTLRIDIFHNFILTLSKMC